MKTKIFIRAEQPEDAATIADLTNKAFEVMRFGDGTEGEIINRLRDKGTLALSLVAVQDDGTIVGQVTLSPIHFEPASSGTWLGLGPVAVVEPLQRQGIGSALVAEALKQAQDMGHAGVGLVGNPKVYGPMGFSSDNAITHQGLPAEHVQALAFSGPMAAGEMIFDDAFEG